MKPIMFIAPHMKLYERTCKLVRQYYSDKVDVQLGNLQEGVRIALKAKEDGALCIVSRGGTYSKIKEAIDLPAVELKLSALDLFRTLQGLPERAKPTALIGHSTIFRSYDEIQDLFPGNHVTRVTLNYSQTLENQIRHQLDNGIQVIIGDSSIYRVALAMGAEAYYIESSDEAVLNTINEAIRVVETTHAETVKAEQYAALMNSCSDGAIMLDDMLGVLMSNTNAERLLKVNSGGLKGKSAMDVLGNDVARHIYATRDKPCQNIIYRFNRKQFMLNVAPIWLTPTSRGYVLTFQSTDRIYQLEKKIRISQLKEQGFTASYTFDDIIHKSATMENCIRKAEVYAQHDASILITGESGSGKELLAQSIHCASRRRNEPFVAVNCAAIAPTLIESELFGYADGAFTGAKKGGKKGLFEMAHRGTIFLDEISEIPLDLQGRLLRVLQEKQVMPVGDDRVIPIDVRVICATNKNLWKLVEDGDFRQDLLYRINVLSLNVPPLSQRREDIPLLAEYFLTLLEEGAPVHSLSAEAAAYLEGYTYPGNVRQLQNIIERAAILAENPCITVKDLAECIDTPGSKQLVSPFAKKLSLQELEREYIAYLRSQAYSTKDICEILGITRNTLHRKESGAQK